MPSFATDVKNELARFSVRRKCCQRAELASLLRMGASLIIGGEMKLGLSFVTENAAVARRVLQLLKVSGEIQPEVTVSRARQLKKNNRYTLRVAPAPNVRGLLEELNVLEFDSSKGSRLLKKRCCRMAFLRGAFLGGGTVNRPEAESHLEFVTDNYTFAADVVHILKTMDFPVGFTDRRKRYQIYLKDGEAIMDLLSILGSVKAVTELEIARNLREVKNQANRLVNCETANLQKTVEASVRQVAAIRKIINRGGLEALPEKLQLVARARLEEPSASLAELAELVGVSRSCINQRLTRLEALAEVKEESHFEKTDK